MTWVRLDDTFPEHPKVLEAGGDAGWLHVCALAYCARILTDGLIPRNAVARLSDRKHPTKLADRLVVAGIWDRDGDDYRIHDYLKYNPSREQVESERAARSEARSKAGKLGGVASGIAKRKHDGKHDGKQTGSKPVANCEANDEAKSNDSVAPTRPDPSLTNKSSSQLQVRDDETVTTTLEQRVADAIEHHARTSAAKANRPAAYAATVRNNTLIEHGAAMTEYARTNPDATREQIAWVALVGQAEAQTEAREAWYADPHCGICGGDGLQNHAVEGAPSMLAPCPCRRPEPWLATVTDIRAAV